LLEVSELVARYGSVEALRGVSLEVRAGEMVALIGANGAGKSTLLRSITGLLPPAGGRVRLDGRDLTSRPPEEILRAGIALVPERRRVFGGLTVLDNLQLGGYALPRGRGFHERLEEGIGEAYRLFPVLRQRRDQLAGTLSGGEQQMLAIARALMSRPRILLCDEPSLGLAPLVVREIFRIVRTINREEGVSVLLVEQNAAIALDLADHAYLLETGRVVMSGPSADLRRNDSVRRSYLGY
jgi:branched-chain amino acid transport system ATP-binding protein